MRGSEGGEKKVVTTNFYSREGEKERKEMEDNHAKKNMRNAALPRERKEKKKEKRRAIKDALTYSQVSKGKGRRD